ncbi:MAG: DUF4434 domain-containing protein [Clostridia bacterium]|nr:DUF4434 domain-containing protein [Clostridia bacterium]MBO7738010.1 DUF4434 domain-containing protein [Clostridia bacterium]
MKKRLLSLILLAFVLCGAFAACTPSENSSQAESVPQVSAGDVSEDIKTEKDYPVLCGSFMQPGAFTGHSLSRMKEHLGYMLDVGIDILILQWSFVTEGDKVSSVFYESSFGGDKKAASYDESGKMLLDTILAAAEELGVKVFIGLNENPEWWNKYVSDKNWLTQQSELGIEGAKQMYDTYKSKYPNAFHGWYFVFEFSNMNATDAQLDNAAYLLRTYRNGLYEIDPEMPIMLSPFLTASGPSPEKTGEMWEKIFAKAEFRPGDIFCCQDSVGAGHITIDMLDAFYREIKEAVDTVEGFRFWANNEDFTQSDWTTAPLNRFVEQMNISSKYVEAHVTFAYSHYQNPDMGKAGQHQAYKTYYETGKVPASTMTKPEITIDSSADGSSVHISGSIANDDGTVAGIRIFKNGSLLRYIDFSSDYGKKVFNFQYDDSNFSGSGVAEYVVYGVDFYGNEGPEEKAEVEFTGKEGVNVALNKTYTIVNPPADNYPDEKGVSLTDGVLGNPTYSDVAWLGFLAKAEVIIDLGDTTEQLYAVEVDTLGGGNAGIYAAASLVVYVSDDGVNFTQVATKTYAPDDGTNEAYTFTRAVFLPENTKARYVKVDIVPLKSWMFIDEVSVYSDKE